VDKAVKSTSELQPVHVHEVVFAVFALEKEPVDPRL